MTIQTLGWVQFRTHRVTVSKDDLTDRIYCFKHTHDRCEFESFDSEWQAADYIVEPMSYIKYEVQMDLDSD
jgi:hypothetical protein